MPACRQDWRPHDQIRRISEEAVNWTGNGRESGGVAAGDSKTGSGIVTAAASIAISGAVVRTAL